MVGKSGKKPQNVLDFNNQKQINKKLKDLKARRDFLASSRDADEISRLGGKEFIDAPEPKYKRGDKNAVGIITQIQITMRKF